jgi:glucuronoarabinoxylan endo-1,4-beta-xylanase
MTMKPARLSLTGIGIALLVAACTSGSDNQGGSGGMGTGGGTTTGGKGGSGTGGSTGGTTSTGGTGGGTGGSVGTTGGTGGGAGTASSVGGSAGASGGSAGTLAAGGSGPAGAPGTGGTGGMPVGSGGVPAAGGAGGGAGTGTGGVGPAGSGGGGSTDVTVQLAMTKQTIEGFGINDTWAPAMSDSDADAMFSADKGMGLTILRVGMNDQGDVMSSNITADIPKAKSHGATKIIGSCWSPPANCKDNNSLNDGGHVKSTCYDSWGTSITTFAKNNGLYAMSIANEPDFASCGTAEPCNGNYPTTLYTSDEMVAFVKSVGPKLQAAGIKVIAPEASEWLHNWSNNSATGSEPSNKNSSDPLKCGFPTGTMCAAGKGYDYGHGLFADKTAWAAFDIMGVHEYDTQHAEPWPADVTDKKETWQTEMSGVKWWPEQGPSSDIKNGVAVAGWVHSALTVGEASAWLWWWWNANNTDDNEGIYLKSGTDTKRHYTIANYSKFVRPGYTAVAVTGTAPTGILLSAYKGSDGTVVIVAINNGSADATVPITIAGGTAPAMLTPWVTSSADNLVSKAAVATSGGVLMAALPAMTVTSFVGK